MKKNNTRIILLIIALLLMISGCNKISDVDNSKDLSTSPLLTSEITVEPTFTSDNELSTTSEITSTLTIEELSMEAHNTWGHSKPFPDTRPLKFTENCPLKFTTLIIKEGFTNEESNCNIIDSIFSSFVWMFYKNRGFTGK